MKSYNNLWDKFLSDENIALAIKNAKRGKSKRKSVRKYLDDPDFSNKVKRYAMTFKNKKKLTIYTARQMLSYLGWIKCADVYGFYIKHIKPYVNFGKLKRYVSRYDLKHKELAYG